MTVPEAGSELWADRQPDAAPCDGSRRLWSLWDMLSINAGPFAEALSSIAQMKTLIEIMNNYPKAVPENWHDGLRGAISGLARALRAECDALGLNTSLGATDNLLSFMEKSSKDNCTNTASS